MQKRVYPSQIYDKVRSDLAISYIKHEFRKLLWSTPKKHFKEIDKTISNWTRSPVIGFPRDFWNGFYGIIMGFRLKIFLIYLITAENINWTLEKIPVNKLNFGVEHGETRHIRSGKLPAKEVIDFYARPENVKIKTKFIKLNERLSNETPPRDNDPIVAFQKIEDGNLVNSVHDGNRRLAKACLEGKDKILTYLGTYTTEEKLPKNYWIPTSVLMENLFFAKLAFDSKNNELFTKYMEILKDMLSKSESASYEMKNRAVTRSQPFRSKVFEALGIEEIS